MPGSIKPLAFTILFLHLQAHATNPRADTLMPTLVKLFRAAKHYSLYRQQVDWDEIQSKILKDSTAVLNVVDFRNRVKLLFSAIGDRHAALFTKGYKISADDSSRAAISDTLISELKRANPKLRTQLPDDKYGYILLPSNNTKDNLKRLGQAIQDSLCELLKHPLKGIIVDLRANEGGSIYPFFTGIHQLIGDGTFGGFSNFKGVSTTPWKLKKGKFYQNKQIVASVKTNCSCSGKLKIAVLLGPVTASAGEMVAIALKGRKNTIFIGEKTYGLTTGNMTFNIDGYLLALSASYTKDRGGTVYTSSVVPDIEVIGGDNFSKILNDKKVLEAIEWFNTGHSGLK